MRIAKPYFRQLTKSGSLRETMESNCQPTAALPCRVIENSQALWLAVQHDQRAISLSLSMPVGCDIYMLFVGCLLSFRAKT